MKPKLRILVIEDSEDDALLVLHQMKKGSYDIEYERIVTAEGMRAALKEKPWDIILSDYQMPHFNGLEALTVLKESGTDIPLIVISGAIGEDIAVETMRNGAQDYIMKNNLQRLLPAVERELRESKIRTEQKSLELKQKQVEARLHLQSLALEAAANCILITDKDGTILWANHAFTVLTGYTLEEAIGQNLRILKSGVHDAAFYKHLWQTILSGNVWRSEIMNRRKDGALYTEEATITPVKNQEGKITHFIAVKNDITARKQIEEKFHTLNAELEQRVQVRTHQLQLARDAAEKANRAKSTFLANMSHELRTPLNAILGYSQLMQRSNSLLAEHKEVLAIINRSGEHLLALINDVLEISKIEVGQSVPEITMFDLHALFGDLESMLGASARTKGLQFEITGTSRLPRYVVADENKLRQVLINILGNAVKFTEQGSIIMRVAVKNEASDGARLAVEVEDTGIGICENELDKLFIYFEQTAGGRAKKSGTGLGLAISRDYVRMMGGDITVAGQEGKGSTFRFEISIREGSESEFREKTSTERNVISLAPGRKIPRILVVEDMEESRALLVKLLEVTGFEVQAAANGREAVERFERFLPDFIWMDVRMPVMDGLTATRRIKESKAGKSVIIAALTAHALKEERTTILAAGCDDVVRKPFREEEIFKVMKKHLGLTYVYEKKPEEAEPPELDIQLSREQLASLPEDLIRRLHDAAVRLDTDLCPALIETIAGHDPSVGSVFRRLAGKLDYDGLLRLLEVNAYHE
jgi:PAS domain S-box-containing protein